MSHPSDRARIAQDTDFPPQALHKRHPNEVAAAGVIYDKEGAQKARSELQDWELAQAKAAAATGKKVPVGQAETGEQLLHFEGRSPQNIGYEGTIREADGSGPVILEAHRKE